MIEEFKTFLKNMGGRTYITMRYAISDGVTFGKQMSASRMESQYFWMNEQSISRIQSRAILE